MPCGTERQIRPNGTMHLQDIQANAVSLLQSEIKSGLWVATRLHTGYVVRSAHDEGAEEEGNFGERERRVFHFEIFRDAAFKVFAKAHR